VQERAGEIDLIVDGNSPHVDGEEETDEQNVVRREKVGKDKVRDTLLELSCESGKGAHLRSAIEEVESVGREGRGVAIGVVGLVDVLVDDSPVESSVNPVDQKVRHKKEEWDGEEQVSPAWKESGQIEAGVEDHNR